MPQLDAVIIRDLTYVIGSGRGKRVILNKINLTIPEGSIYGLLGPSGCGKTTMLRCVVGRVRARSGRLLVFGLKPGDSAGGVPGRDVGYMPQEISIYEDFTIEETLQYFGKINRMLTGDIKKRIQFLIQFLDLPSKKRLVVNLSGGQKRRVSLAAALVHSPPLLILDEPTVGVDPLLRQSIWKHLVTLTEKERISVLITTHYIEEARQANVVGLMRHGRILAENSPDELMRIHQLTNLEDVFLKLCMTDSSKRAAKLAISNGIESKIDLSSSDHRADMFFVKYERELARQQNNRASSRLKLDHSEAGASSSNYSHRWKTINANVDESNNSNLADEKELRIPVKHVKVPIQMANQPTIKTYPKPLNTIVLNEGYVNEAVENFSSEDELSLASDTIETNKQSGGPKQQQQVQTNYKNLIKNAPHNHEKIYNPRLNLSEDSMSDLYADDYLAIQAVKWATRKSNAISLRKLSMDKNFLTNNSMKNMNQDRRTHSGNRIFLWFITLMAVTWKNYIRLRRNPPVLIFQFVLPAIQVILFCLCIGGEPFDVPVAIVNDEKVPRSSLQFLNGLNKKIIRQVKYNNLTSAMEAVKRGHVWGAIHIPDKYSQNLQSRLIMGEDVSSETISNGTIRVYPDLTNLHLALALETTFRETFINFAKNNLEEMGYDKSLADLPIQVGKPIYGTLRKDGYLEFMAPGVVISISYVMATGLTALSFILERRDGLLERSLVSGVQTSQILLAHAINQVVVMVIQIFLVLGCTFFVFEIPSRGPFAWVVLLILLQGCTGMGFGLLVSAICKEENTAVMMVVGTFYTNLILAGIIWPIEAMPHWIRPLSYAQPQTIPTESLRNILSRGWGITETGVLIGFVVTIGWLAVFLMLAGVIFRYSR